MNLDGNTNLNEEKNDLLGELDHLNSFIGLAKSFLKDEKKKKLLTDIQNDIFLIQANIASPDNIARLPENITYSRVLEIQMETCAIEQELSEIRNFIIPDGATGACLMHCLRTEARAIERKIPGYLEKPAVLAAYFDRTAGLFFALARKINLEYGFTEKAPTYVK